MRFLATIMVLTMILTALLTACGGSGQAASSGQGPGNGADGQALFTSNCSTCHGPTGGGLPGLGKPLTTSEFVGGLSDEELLEFIKIGRPADDPLNTSGVLMPPKGGNPSLTDEQLQAIIAYIRSTRTD